MAHSAGITGPLAVAEELGGRLRADASMFARIRVTPVSHSAGVEDDVVLAAIFLQLNITWSNQAEEIRVECITIKCVNYLGFPVGRHLVVTVDADHSHAADETFLTSTSDTSCKKQ